MRTLASVRKIVDPEKRLAAAAELAREAAERADVERDTRAVAVVVMHRTDGVKQVDVIERLNFPRTILIRALNRAPEPLPEIEDAEKVARDAHRNVRKYDAIAVEAREIRDALIHSLIDEEGYRNAQVARIAQMNTARLAQIRKPLAG